MRLPKKFVASAGMALAVLTLGACAVNVPAPNSSASPTTDISTNGPASDDANPGYKNPDVNPSRHSDDSGQAPATDKRDEPVFPAIKLTQSTCHLDQDGVLVRVAEAINTPAGTYRTTAQYKPEGSNSWVNYTGGITNPGYTAKENSLPDWKWACTADSNSTQDDPPGEYRINIRWNNGTTVTAKLTVK